jgi:hypothetical protein
MLTKVENPSSKSGSIQIEVNGIKQSATIDPGKTLTVKNTIKLKPGSRDVEVRIKGDKTLVMLETAFQ